MEKATQTQINTIFDLMESSGADPFSVSEAEINGLTYVGAEQTINLMKFMAR